MDYSNPIQIKNILNLLDPNYPELKYENMHQIHDPLYYIKGPKTVIKFINSDYIIYKVRIPKTINKFDLHSIAQFYKHDKTLYSNIILIYKNNILDSDKTSIDFISEDDEFRIIETRTYPDDTFYNYLFQKKGEKMNIIVNFNTGQKVNLILSGDITVSEMIKAFNLKFGIENKYNKLIYNANRLTYDDKRKIREVVRYWDKIVSIKATNPPYTIGKTVVINISYTEKNIEGWVFEIGLLNSINYVIKKVEAFHKRKVKKLFVINKELNRNDDRCLLEIGIKENFYCLIELEK